MPFLGMCLETEFTVYGMTLPRNRFARSALLGCVLLCSVAGRALPADPEPATPAVVAGAPRQYSSQHLTVHTDLPPVAAQELVDRLEQTLQLASRYWGRAPQRRIVCYVVDDLANWPESVMPHRLARVFVGGVSGATVGGAEANGRSRRPVATVYASTQRGVAEHEIVHAYCSQNYGSTGPYWYREGMAEMVVMGSGRASGLRCTDRQFQALRANDARTIADVVATGHSSQAIEKSLEAKLVDPKNRDRNVPASDWTIADRDNALKSRDENLKCWLFCYLLLHNRNYSDRFRSLGPVILSSADGFTKVFGAYQREIEFEYDFLLNHLSPGYRVDLCSWDWAARFETLEDQASVTARVRAAQGYQASGLTLAAGRSYAFRTSGHWSTSATRGKTDAAGHHDGQGQLVGVVMNDYRLCEPFGLGASGRFTAPFNGDLYLRCDDPWNELDDNQGTISVTLRYEYR